MWSSQEKARLVEAARRAEEARRTEEVRCAKEARRRAEEDNYNNDGDLIAFQRLSERRPARRPKQPPRALPPSVLPRQTFSLRNPSAMDPAEATCRSLTANNGWWWALSSAYTILTICLEIVILVCLYFNWNSWLITKCHAIIRKYCLILFQLLRHYASNHLQMYNKNVCDPISQPIEVLRLVESLLYQQID